MRRTDIEIVDTCKRKIPMNMPNDCRQRCALTTTAFCHDWRFHKGDDPGARDVGFPDGDWQPVVVPHTWNADDMYHGRPMAEAYVGPAWYRKHFTLRRPADGGRIFLTFEAVANHSEVWVDGCFVGGRDGGFLGFRLDITDALAEGDQHLIAVRADNAPRADSVPPNPIDWERYGGIYRPVWLVVAAAAHFDFCAIRVRTPRVTADIADVVIRTGVRDTARREGALELRHRIVAPDGDEVAVASQPVGPQIGTVWCDTRFDGLRGLQLWSPNSPTLYRVVSELRDGETLLDRQENPLGFRWFRFDADEGFFLNGEPMKLCGVNMHQDYPGLGNACPERFHRRDIALVKQAGMNFVRGSHYPRNERALTACDELGLLVMEEQPFWHGSLRTAGGERLLEHGQSLMRDLVRQHGNHPCIIGWNTVNEIMLTLDPVAPHPDPKERVKSLHALPRHEWPFALRGVEALSGALQEADPDRPTCVVVGGWWRENVEAGVTEKAGLVAYNGGAMHGMVDGEPVYDGLRRKHPRWVHMMSEGVLNDGAVMRGDWERELPFWRTCAKHWSRVYQRPWFCGGAMWVWADYSAKGTYRNSGCVDDARLPYESYWFFQSQWATEPTAHLCGHWSWNDKPGTARDVVVFSNCADVSLSLNGRDLGPGDSTGAEYPGIPHPPRLWRVPWEPGRLEARGRQGAVEVVDARVTESVPDRLLLHAESEAVQADGQDVCFLRADVVDAAGNRCYRTEGTLRIAVAGGAVLAGPATRALRGGLCGFAVRSNAEAGAVTVTAEMEGCEATCRRLSLLQSTNGSIA